MPDIKMDRIYNIESSNQPEAYNKATGARGLGQITDAALKDWNNAHSERQYTQEDMFDQTTNMEVSNWYMNTEIPRLLKHFKIKDTVENRLISYNYGIGHLVNKDELPEETTNYIMKYMLGGDVRIGQKRLKDLGFDPGPLDGIIGPKTKAAWDKFQDSNIEAGPANVNFGIHNLKE